MLSSDDLRETLAGLLKTALHWEQPLPEGDLAEHFDSVERLTLVVAIEDHFEISFDAEDEDAVSTMADVIALVRSKIEGRDA